MTDDSPDAFPPCGSQPFLSQASSRVSAVAMGVAHDYNNLLAAIVGNAAILNRYIGSDPRAIKSAGLLTAGSQDALDLTHQILVYTGRAPVNVETLDVSALAESVASEFSTAAPGDTRIEFVCPGGLPSIPGDVSQIRTLVANFLANAVDALACEAGHIRLRLASGECDGTYPMDALGRAPLPAGPYVSVEIRDDGCGIPSDIESSIFDPFFTTKLRARGMGLPVALGILRAHKGTLVLDSRPGEGSVFTALLPTWRAQETSLL